MKNTIVFLFCFGTLGVIFSCKTQQVSIAVSEEKRTIEQEMATDEIKFKDFTLMLNLVLETGKDENNTFNSPCAVATDQEGNIYTVDRRNHRIQVFSKDGKYVRTIGHKGAGHGEFSSPHDLKLDDNIYVVDYKNKRIQILSKEGKFLNSFNVSFYPDQIVTDKNFIYISMYLDGKHLVYKYSKKGKFIMGFGKVSKVSIRDFRAHNEVNLTSDLNGNLYLAYRFLPKMKKYSPDGKLLMEFEYQPSIKNKKPPNIKKIISRKMIKISPQEIIGYTRSVGRAYPVCYDIAVDRSGIIYLLVATDHEKDEICDIYRFDPSGKLLEKVALPMPCGKIHVDSSNNFYFLSQMVNMLVYRYTPTQ